MKDNWLEEFRRIALRATELQNAMEDKVSLERFGCKFDDLTEDLRGEIAMDVADMLYAM